jgi:broad specificity phosphatase PhoE
MKRIYIVRHGKTYLNRYNKMQGWCDSPLTKEGIAGAERVGQELKDVPFDIALSSDTKRASLTCQTIVQANCQRDEIQQLQSPFFREHFYGSFEGSNQDEAWRAIGTSHGYPSRSELIKNVPIDQVKDWIKAADPYHDAENAQEYWARLDKGLKLIAELDGAENILLVTHGFTIQSLAQRYGEHVDASHGPQNCSITIMTMTAKKIAVTSYGQLHL